MSKKPVFKIRHPGAMLKQTLEELGVSQYRFAKLTGINPTLLNGICNERRAITAETAIRLGRAFNCSPLSFLRHQEEFDVQEIQNAKRGAFEHICPLPAYADPVEA